MPIALQTPPVFGTPQKQNTQSIGVPAPIRGIIANNPMYTDVEVENAAIWLYNLIPRELGCGLRPGSKYFATDVPDNTANPGEIRTIMYYNSVVAAGAGGVDFMFVATDAGIFDVTAGGAGPWTAKVVRVNDVQLSLDDIEHYILLALKAILIELMMFEKRYID